MRKVFLALVISTVSLGSYAQSNSLGISGGFGKSSINNFDKVYGATNTEFMPHGNVGISFIHSTKINLGFGADVKYSWEGAQAENSTTGKEQVLSMQYVRVPLKVMYFFGKYGQRVRPKIYAGPSMGFLVAAKYSTEQNGVSTPEVNIKDQFNGFDIGVVGGAGINYRLVKNTWFTADVNYYNSFRDIREQDVSGSPRLSNNTLALNVGVNWGIGK